LSTESSSPASISFSRIMIFLNSSISTLPVQVQVKVKG
jgi:hypothetical protein